MFSKVIALDEQNKSAWLVSSSELENLEELMTDEDKKRLLDGERINHPVLTDIQLTNKKGL